MTLRRSVLLKILSFSLGSVLTFSSCIQSPKFGSETESVNNPKTTERGPTEILSSETNPLTDTIKSIESVDEQKPSEIQDTIKSQNDKKVAKLIPVAEPVVTDKEAWELNAEAINYVIAEKEKREPFYSLYENRKLKTVCF